MKDLLLWTVVIHLVAFAMLGNTSAEDKKLEISLVQTVSVKEEKSSKAKNSFFKNLFNSFKGRKERPEDKLNNHIKERMEMIEKKILEKQKENVKKELKINKKNQEQSAYVPVELKPSQDKKVTTEVSGNVTNKELKPKEVKNELPAKSEPIKPQKKNEVKKEKLETLESKSNVPEKIKEQAQASKSPASTKNATEKKVPTKPVETKTKQQQPVVQTPKANADAQKLSEQTKQEESTSEKEMPAHPLLGILKNASIKSPELIGSLNNYRVSQFEEQLQKASDRHSLSLISNWSTEQDRSPNNVDSLTEGRVGLRFQKNLWDPPAKPRIESAEYGAREKKALLEVQRQVFYERTCRLYLNLFRMENTLELAKLNRGVNYDNFIATSDRYQEGELTRTDKELASTRFNVSKAVLVDAEYQRNITRAEFKKVTGMSAPNELVHFDIDSNHILMREIVSGNQQSIYFPEMAAMAALESQEKIYEVSKYNQWPILSLTAESAFLEETGSLATRVDWEHSIGVNLSIPLYNGGALKFDREREWARVKVMESQLEITRREKESEIERILATLKYNEMLKKHYIKAEEAADEMVKGFREEYRVGTRTSTDLLDAENERFTVKVKRLNSELDLTLSKISLLRVFGLLDHETLSRLMVTVSESVKK